MLLPKTCLGLIFHSLTAVSVMRLSILFKVAVFKKICDLLDKGYNNQNIAFVLLPLHMEYYFLQFHCLNMCLSLFIHLFIYPYSLTWDYTLHVICSSGVDLRKACTFCLSCRKINIYAFLTWFTYLWDCFIQCSSLIVCWLFPLFTPRHDKDASVKFQFKSVHFLLQCSWTDTQHDIR